MLSFRALRRSRAEWEFGRWWASKEETPGCSSALSPHSASRFRTFRAIPPPTSMSPVCSTRRSRWLAEYCLNPTNNTVLGDLLLLYDSSLLHLLVVVLERKRLFGRLVERLQPLRFTAFSEDLDRLGDMAC